MTRMPMIQLEDASGVQEALLHQVKKSLGIIPNMTKTMANSPSALKAYLQLAGAVAGGVLGPNTRERIALAMAQVNGCDYCLSAHSLLGPGAGLSAEDILDARKANASDPKNDAILKFVVATIRNQGATVEGQISDLRAAGVTNEEIGEVVAVIALNTLTNFFNQVADVDIDFPIVKASEL